MIAGDSVANPALVPDAKTPSAIIACLTVFVVIVGRGPVNSGRIQLACLALLPLLLSYSHESLAGHESTHDVQLTWLGYEGRRARLDPTSNKLQLGSRNEVLLTHACGVFLRPVFVFNVRVVFVGLFVVRVKS